VPSQNSSGGKPSLGRITKRGDDYLRTLLIQGAKSAVMSAGKRDDATSKWLPQLTARASWQKACVAMANKNARIAVGGDDARGGVRCQARERQAAGQMQSASSARQAAKGSGTSSGAQVATGRGLHSLKAWA